MDGAPITLIQAATPPPGDSELHEYLAILWRRRWTVVVTTVLAVIAAGAYVFARPARYQATAELQLQPQIPQVLLQASGAPEQAQVNVPTQIAVIESRAVATLARRIVPEAPPVSATEVGVSESVALSVRSADPRQAAAAANAYANAYLAYEHQQTAAVLRAAATSLQQRLQSVDQLIGLDQLELTQPSLGPRAASGIDAGLGTLESQAATLGNRINAYDALISSPTGESGQLVSAATVPTGKAHSARALLLGAVGGIVAGVGLALLRESFARDVAARVAAEHRPTASVIPGRVTKMERATGTP